MVLACGSKQWHTNGTPSEAHPGAQPKSDLGVRKLAAALAAQNRSLRKRVAGVPGLFVAAKLATVDCRRLGLQGGLIVKLDRTLPLTWP